MHWKRWGPYLSERAWGTVREDYSPTATPGTTSRTTTPRSRAYRWNEDGLAGICDRHQRLCFALALWNGRDPILKERLFGLTGHEGNHGEDVKEYYFYLDATPTHSLHADALQVSAGRVPLRATWSTRTAGAAAATPEYELIDTGVFDDDRYFDVFVEYAKADPDDILIRITATNRGPEAARAAPPAAALVPQHLDLGPDEPAAPRRRPAARRRGARHRTLGRYVRHAAGLDCRGRRPTLLFTENETNARAPVRRRNGAALRQGRHPRRRRPRRADAGEPGTRAAPRPRRTTALDGAGRRQRDRPRLRLRRTRASSPDARRSPTSTQVFAARLRRGRRVLRRRSSATSPTRTRGAVQRQALAGMLWSKQFYHYDVEHWLDGDPAAAAAARRRARHGRNQRLAAPRTTPTSSRCPTSGSIPGTPPGTSPSTASRWRWSIPDFAKEQLMLLLREWYMHPNGQMPAYEWAFGDVNPPVHAWAAWRVYKIDADAAAARATAPSSSASSTSCCSTSPGGSTARTPRGTTSSRAASSASTTSASSTAARRCRPAATSSRPTAPAGWRCSASNMLAIALELALRQPGLRGHRHQVLRALPLHRAAR